MDKEACITKPTISRVICEVEAQDLLIIAMANIIIIIVGGQDQGTTTTAVIMMIETEILGLLIITVGTMITGEGVRDTLIMIQ